MGVFATVETLLFTLQRQRHIFSSIAAHCKQQKFKASVLHKFLFRWFFHTGRESLSRWRFHIISSKGNRRRYSISFAQWTNIKRRRMRIKYFSDSRSSRTRRAVLKSFFLMWHHWATSCCTNIQSARDAKLNALRVLDMSLLRQNFMQMQSMFQRWTQFNSESKSNRDRSTIQVLHCIHTEANKDESIQTKMKQNLQKTQKTYFSHWNRVASYSRRLRGVAAKAVRRLSNLALSRAFSRWHAHVMQLVQQRATMARAIQRIVRPAVMFCAFSGWNTVCVESAESRKQEQEFALSLSKVVESEVRKAGRNELAAERRAKQCDLRLKLICLAIWVERVQAMRRLRGVAAKAVRRLSNLALSRAFSRWHAHVMQLVQQRATMARAIQRIVRPAVMFCAFSGWNTVCVESAESRKQEQEFALSLSKVVESEVRKAGRNELAAERRAKQCDLRLKLICLAIWVERVQAMRRLRGVAAKAVRRLSNLALSRAFSRWHAHVMQLVQQRATMARAIQRIVRPAVMFCAFSGWNTVCVESAESRKQEQEFALSLSKVVESEVRKAGRNELAAERRAKQCDLRLKLICLAIWVERVQAMRRLRGVAAKAVRRLSNLALSRAFSRWHAHVMQLVQQRATMARAIQRIVRPAVMFCAFSGWNTVCVESAESRKQEQEFALSLSKVVESEARKAGRNELAAERRAKQCDLRLKLICLAIWVERVQAMRRLRGVAAKAVRRLSNLALSRAFSRWHAHVMQLVQQRATMARAIQRIVRPAVMFCAFSGWNTVCVESAESRKQEQEFALSLSKVVESEVRKAGRNELAAERRAKQCDLRLKLICLAIWVERVQAMRRLRGVAAKAVRRLSNLALSRAFSRWHAHVMQLVQQRATMARAIQRIVRPAVMFCAFSGWNTVCVESAESRKQEQEFALSLSKVVENEARKAGRNELAAERRAKQCDLRLKLICLAIWVERVQAMRRLRGVAAKAVRRLSNLALSRAFSRWHAHVMQLVQQRATMARAIQRIVRPAVMFCAFSGWNTVCVESAESRKQEQEFALSLSKVVESEARKAGRNELAAERRAKQCDLRLKLICLAIWVERVQAMRRLRGVAAKAVRRLSNLALSRAFSRWHAHVMQLVQQLDIGNHRLQIYHNSHRSLFMKHWMAKVQMIRRLRRFSTILLFRLIFSSFHWWFEYLQFKRWLHSVKVSFFHRVVALRHVFRAFACWTAQVSGQKFLRAVLIQRNRLVQKSNTFLRIVWRRSLSGFVLFCFANWSALLKLRRRLETFCRYAEQRRASRVVLIIFRGWRAKTRMKTCASVQQANSSALSQVEIAQVIE
jgi:flagellar biosynthesis regulator FlaF